VGVTRLFETITASRPLAAMHKRGTHTHTTQTPNWQHKNM